MFIRRTSTILSSEITDERLYYNRRQFMATFGVAAIGGTLIPPAVRAATEKDDDLTPWEAVTGYNNFYEFGTGKQDPKRNAQAFITNPWSVDIEGEVKEPRKWELNELIDGFEVEERVYRLRCVEGWSMVVPWNGFPLHKLIDRLEPTSKARYVEFTTLLDPKQMFGQRTRTLEWPYVEGLRLDEAMNPLTLMVTGVYGKDLPPQNGAPIRLIIPWKYGFKGGKSIVKIRFTKKEPRTAWNIAIPHEYGFYANVNPNVDHPRWTQAKERRIGDFFKIDTLMFNGYEDEVASMYSGMDLRKYY